MSTQTVLRAPNPDVIGKLTAINDDSLFGKYQPLRVTHTAGHAWNRAMVVGAFVLEALALFAYRNTHKYATVAAATLGFAGVFTLYKSRVAAQIETPEYAAQKAAIKQEFDGVGPELRTAWEVASKLIAMAVLATKRMKTVDAAIPRVAEMLDAYLTADSWRVSSDPIVATHDSQKPWREVYKALSPEVKKLAQLNLDDYTDARYNPLIIDELKALQPEAIRFVAGKAPSDGRHPFVECTMEGKDADAKLVVRPWAV